MPIVSVTLPNDGETADAADVDNPINAILAVLNGNIDQDNIADGGVTSAKLATGAVTAAKLAADAKTGWNDISTAVASVTNNGQRSYDLVFNSTNLTSVLSNGMRLKLPRSVAPPTQCTSLNGSSEFWRNTTPSGITFTDDFSFSVWVKMTAYPVSSGTIGSRYNGTSGFTIGVDNNGRVGITGFSGGSGNYRQVLSYQSIPINRWVRLSGSLDMSGFTSSTCKIQINDVDVPVVLNSAGTNPTSLVQAGNLEVGAANGTNLFTGRIKELALFNAIVTPSTFKTYSGQGMTGSETNCIGLWKFNGDGNDSNANANNLVAQSTAVATDTSSPMNTTEYAVIVANSFSTNTTLTVQVPEGYSLPTSGGLGTVSYALSKVPYGFPAQKDKWEVRALWLSASGLTTASTPSSWQPLTGTDFSLPVGAWDLSYSAITTGQCSTTAAQSFAFQIDSTTPSAGNPTNPTQVFNSTQLAGSNYLVGMSSGSVPLSVNSATVYKLYGIHTAGASVAIYIERGEATVAANLAYI